MKRKAAIDMIKLLLEHKANPDFEDQAGLGPKAGAVRETRKDVLDDSHAKNNVQALIGETYFILAL